MSTGRQSPSRRWFRGAAALVLLGLVAPGAFAQQAPAPTLEEEIRAFCGNIADAARDQRYLLQKKELEELQAEVDERIGLLEERSAKYREWLKKREDFMQVAESQLVEIYKNMRSRFRCRTAGNRQAGHCGGHRHETQPAACKLHTQRDGYQEGGSPHRPSLPQRGTPDLPEDPS
jgi:hypothetical protein